MKTVKAMKWACRGRGLRTSQPSTLADEGDEGREGDEVSSSGWACKFTLIRFDRGWWGGDWCLGGGGGEGGHRCGGG